VAATLKERITRIETLTEQHTPILRRLDAALPLAVTQAQCETRRPTPLTAWGYFKRATAILAFLGMLSTGAAGVLHLAGKEIRDLAEPPAYASPRASVPAPRDAGR
jgi:hypothetical protein